MHRYALIALASLLLAGCEAVSSSRDDAGYRLTARSGPFDLWWPSQSLLIGKAADLCPTGYEQLGARAGDNESVGGHFIEWRIRCNDGETLKPH